MNPRNNSIKRIIGRLSRGAISRHEAFEKLKDLPYSDLGFAKLDNHRQVRKGFPEVIYARGKALNHLEKITAYSLNRRQPLIITKAEETVYSFLKSKFPVLKYSNTAQIIYYTRKRPVLKKGFVSVVTAGTSDINVAEEAAVTLEVMGNKIRRVYDVGVAGIHRVFDKRRLLAASRVVIVIAGMEGALASVVAGLINKPVIAVPTSVGYGASFKGLAPLLTMLNCCAPGTVVVNIDNGFGAAYFADMIQ